MASNLSFASQRLLYQLKLSDAEDTTSSVRKLTNWSLCTLRWNDCDPPNAGDPPGSRQVYDSFTTKNHSRWISFSFGRDTFMTCSRLVHNRFLLATGSRQDQTWTSREVGSVAGDLANLRPECRHVIFTLSDIITWFYKPKPSHDVETKPTLLETYFFGGSSSTSRHYLTTRSRHVHDNDNCRKRDVNLSGTRWITRITVTHSFLSLPLLILEKYIPYLSWHMFFCLRKKWSTLTHCLHPIFKMIYDQGLKTRYYFQWQANF
jgi:hypothetical protein